MQRALRLWRWSRGRGRAEGVNIAGTPTSPVAAPPRSLRARVPDDAPIHIDSDELAYLMRVRSPQKPRWTFRLFGSNQSRYAELQNKELSFQLPPRRTRFEPRVGPVGFLAPLQYFATVATQIAINSTTGVVLRYTTSVRV